MDKKFELQIELQFSKKIPMATFANVISKTGNKDILMAIAKNKNVDAQILKMLSEKTNDDEVISHIMQNKNIDMPTLDVIENKLLRQISFYTLV